jgi:hypothetical protein
MPISKNNFTHVTDTELEGVETTMFTVDFINAMTAETGDLSTGSSTEMPSEHLTVQEM